MSYPDDDLIEYPIDGVLDLHTFQPDDVKELVPDYIQVCLEKNIYYLRIIHGKGTGVLKTIVWSILEKHPDVASFRHADLSGGWGATLVELKRRS